MSPWPENYVEWHPSVPGDEASIAAIPKEAVLREEYGPHMNIARAIVAEYQKNWEQLRDESRNTDVWGVAEDILRLRIAEAIARAVKAARMTPHS